MKKRTVVLLGVVLAVLFCAMPVLADEVVARIELDKGTATLKTGPMIASNSGFEVPVTAYLVIENYSDRDQSVRLLSSYDFSLIRASGENKPADSRLDEFNRSVVLTGTLPSVFKPSQRTLSISAHTKKVIACGQITGLETRYTYKWYLDRGPHIVSVEVPRGLPGTGRNETTETILALE
ncbi:MAG: hypothetical protein KJ880_05535 [Candidatus Omnitrophica bacterium]|nr:hypothetical protein [Candidatus Omnitrophota bacterium]MBU1869168.1 hypothetical protein [Candidatus Omnitrophota bacterium]